QIELLKSGKNFFDVSENLIDSAERYIHFQTYIFDDDATGRRIGEALIRAAQRGVRVYFLLDAFGGRGFSKDLATSFEKAGIFFRRFSPGTISPGFHFSLRLHHKVLLVDGVVTVIGGINIANRYHGTSKMKEWLDFAILIRGPEVAHTLLILRNLWNKTFLSKKERSYETIHMPNIYEEDVKVKVLQNNWYRNKIEILKSYRSALKHAKSHIIIFASYFLPGRHERKLLKDSAARGIDIKIVLSAVSDTVIFNKATIYLYDFILRNKIRIYEYLPSTLHAKVVTVDGIWSSIGSYNMNHLSDYGSVETNADILDIGFSEHFESILSEIIKNDCLEITAQEYSKRKTWLSQFFGWISYQIMRFLMRILFLLTTKKSKRMSQ
ncbi:MAG TPA: phosphatidylserine/phosphatidylglycerophosphate/cardiolipin synthase family protein, partial [Bacteroidales bacterium]|nr:phosphatidylserine/phosphatidylglycerophosphate/cardiolipin synthase family protein [Bacteroidales bacterium]